VRENLKTTKFNGVPILKQNCVQMKYHKFNCRGRYDMFALHTYLKSKKKHDYMVNTGRSKLLDSFFFENQVWGALHKAWKGYVIAKNKDEHDRMKHYSPIIQECQHDLGLPISSFPNIGMSATSFLSEIAQKEDNNSNHVEQEVVSDEQYSDDYHYEQDRLTDDNAYSEYFRDDFNAGDRFTS
jgi:hypothetical protein